ncbi:glycoside hydrolase family protein [Oceanobacter mangrovi]|uniref:glycoside hydrolase family protein n=1 Tax=Oceanobacter mangrovi TaxID=2862510 RepID=UPI001C8E1D45|nr:hypothetical protein [Oceanobacter mangrovi]
MASSIKERLKRIQSTLDCEADGVLGHITLDAIDQALGINSRLQPAATTGTLGLTLTKSGIDTLIGFEVSSREYYQHYLQSPTWPGGQSGITIGIGYDIGYCHEADLRRDWGTRLNSDSLDQLASCCQLTGRQASQQRNKLKHLQIPWQAAVDVFTRTSIPHYGRLLLTTYPGVEQLPPATQTALLSLVYNRGTALEGNNREEMSLIRELVQQQDCDRIAAQIIAMKSIWAGRGLAGLLKRRDAEAAMILSGNGQSYHDDELIHV